VLGPAATVNQDIIKEDEYKPAKEGPQDFVHQGLERGQGIRQAKRHDQEFKQALMRAEHCFVNVVSVHEHLVVARPEIKLGEESRAMKLIQELLHNRSRKLILDRLTVECPVVDAESPGAVRLLDQEHWCRER
jgi:hypothetical protein